MALPPELVNSFLEWKKGGVQNPKLKQLKRALKLQIMVNLKIISDKCQFNRS